MPSDVAFSPTSIVTNNKRKTDKKLSNFSFEGDEEPDF